MKEPFVYIMTNYRRGTLYVGVTSDLRKRVWEHKEGVFEGFTSRYGLKLLVWFERHDSMGFAIQWEKRIKEWKRERKLRIIEELNPGWRDLSEDFL